MKLYAKWLMDKLGISFDPKANDTVKVQSYYMLGSTTIVYVAFYTKLEGEDAAEFSRLINHQHGSLEDEHGRWKRLSPGRES